MPDVSSDVMPEESRPRLSACVLAIVLRLRLSPLACAVCCAPLRLVDVFCGAIEAV
jgi:hypothetical protein